MQRTSLKAISLAIAIGGCISSALQTQSTEVKTGFEFTDEEGRTYRIVGVASITADAVSAWDTTGKISDELTKRLENICRTRIQQDLQFRFSKKNRYILVESSTNEMPVSWRSEGDNYLQSVYIQSPNTEKLALFKISVEPVQSDVNLYAMITSARPNRVDIPVTKGKKTTANGFNVEFSTSIKIETPTAPRYSMPRMKGKCWKLIFSATPVASEDASKTGNEPKLPLYGMSAIGANGKPILYVDLVGNPVSAETYLLDPDEETGYNSSASKAPAKPHKYTKAAVASGMSVTGGISIQTNVNPAFIKSLTYTWNTTKTVRFSNLPLDPK